MVSESLSRPSVMRLLASPSGSIGRAMFIAGAGLLLMLGLAADTVLRHLPNPYGLPHLALALVWVWSALCLARKRLHDLGRSGVLTLQFLAAYIGFVAVLPWLLGWAGLDGGGFTLACALPLALAFAWLAATPGEVAMAAPDAQARPMPPLATAASKA